jgi:hypothetical protein
MAPYLPVHPWGAHTGARMHEADLGFFGLRAGEAVAVQEIMDGVSAAASWDCDANATHQPRAGAC